MQPGHLSNTRAFVDKATPKRLVDIAAVALQMRSFEKVGLTRQQAERLTEHLTGILCVQKEKLGEQFVSKGMLEKARWLPSGRPSAPCRAASPSCSEAEATCDGTHTAGGTRAARSQCRVQKRSRQGAGVPASLVLISITA